MSCLFPTSKGQRTCSRTSCYKVQLPGCFRALKIKLYQHNECHNTLSKIRKTILQEEKFLNVSRVELQSVPNLYSEIGRNKLKSKMFRYTFQQKYTLSNSSWLFVNGFVGFQKVESVHFLRYPFEQVEKQWRTWFPYDKRFVMQIFDIIWVCVPLTVNSHMTKCKPFWRIVLGYFKKIPRFQWGIVLRSLKINNATLHLANLKQKELIPINVRFELSTF